MSLTLGDLIFPDACPACDVTVPADAEPWCPNCVEEVVTAIGREFCSRCGAPVGMYLPQEEGCPECRGAGRQLDGFACVGTYHSIVGEVLKKFKLAQQHRLDRLLGRLLAYRMMATPWCDGIDAVVPVPTTWRSQLRHGGHPARLIADAVSRELRVPVLPLLAWRGKTQRQTELSNTDRTANVRGKLRIDRHARVAGTRLCLIDDVSTTGSTLREMARVLRDSGAAAVYGAAVAKTEPHRSDRETIR